MMCKFLNNQDISKAFRGGMFSQYLHMSKNMIFRQTYKHYDRQFQNVICWHANYKSIGQSRPQNSEFINFKLLRVASSSRTLDERKNHALST